MATTDLLAEADRLREDDLYNQAIELYARLLEDGDSPDAHFGIGQCYGKIYDYDRALRHLDKAFAADADRARELLRDAVPGNRFAALNYLEYLLFTDDDEYPSFRASMEPLDGPAWYPVVVELFDYYRDHLLPGTSDPQRLAAWEASAE